MTPDRGQRLDHRAEGAARLRALAILWALLLALSWQSFVTQTHLHAAAPQSLTVSAIASGSADSSPYDSPANCPICREAAQSGPALLPAPILVTPPLVRDFRAAIALSPTPAREVFSHAWQSRAPPLPLQA